MEYNRINFQVLEECLMAAESKEQLYSLFTNIPSFSLDSEIFAMNSENLPASIKNLPKTLGVTNEKALTVILSLTTIVLDFIAQLDEGICWVFDDGRKYSCFSLPRKLQETTQDLPLQNHEGGSP